MIYCQRSLAFGEFSVFEVLQLKKVDLKGDFGKGLLKKHVCLQFYLWVTLSLQHFH